MNKLMSCAAALCLALAGCGGGDATPSNREAVYTTTGKVTLDGQPLADADITFASDTGKIAGFARTNAEGLFTASTFNSNDGLVAGMHRVSVSKFEVVETAPVASDESDEYVPPAAPAAASRTARKPADAGPKSLVPARYNKPDTSELVVTVEVNGDNVVELPLTSKP